MARCWGTRKGSSCFPEEVAFLSIWASFQRGQELKWNGCPWGGEEACELGEIKHSRQLRGSWMVLGQAVPSALGKQELMLSGSMTGTGCFSRMPLADVAADALCIFAFLPQSLTVNWENIILPPPLPLPPNARSLCTPWPARAGLLRCRHSATPFPGSALPARARWDYVLSAGNGGGSRSLQENGVFIFCVSSAVCTRAVLK